MAFLMVFSLISWDAFSLTAKAEGEDGEPVTGLTLSCTNSVFTYGEDGECGWIKVYLNEETDDEQAPYLTADGIAVDEATLVKVRFISAPGYSFDYSNMNVIIGSAGPVNIGEFRDAQDGALFVLSAETPTENIVIDNAKVVLTDNEPSNPAMKLVATDNVDENGNVRENSRYTDNFKFFMGSDRTFQFAVATLKDNPEQGEDIYSYSALNNIPETYGIKLYRKDETDVEVTSAEYDANKGQVSYKFAEAGSYYFVYDGVAQNNTISVEITEPDVAFYKTSACNTANMISECLVEGSSTKVYLGLKNEFATKNPYVSSYEFRYNGEMLTFNSGNADFADNDFFTYNAAENSFTLKDGIVDEGVEIGLCVIVKYGDGNDEWRDANINFKYSLHGLLLCDNLGNDGFNEIHIDGQGNVWSNYRKEITRKTGEEIDFLLVYNNSYDMNVESDGNGAYAFGNDVTDISELEVVTTHFEKLGNAGWQTADYTEASFYFMRMDKLGNFFSTTFNTAGIYRLYLDDSPYNAESNYVTFIVEDETKTINFYQDEDLNNQLGYYKDYLGKRTWKMYTPYWEHAKATEFYVTASDSKAKSVNIIGVYLNETDYAGVRDSEGRPVPGKYVTPGTPISTSSYTINIDPDTGVAKVEITSAYMSMFGVIVEFEYENGRKEYSFESVNISPSQKGLGLCDRMEHDFENGDRFITVDFDPLRYGDWGNPQFFKNSNNGISGEDYRFLLGWNDSDDYSLVPPEDLVDGVLDNETFHILYSDVNSPTDDFWIEKLNIYSAEYEPYNGDILSVDETLRCFKLTPTESGDYRIYRKINGEKKKESYNWVRINVAYQTKTFDVCRDANCTQIIDPRGFAYSYSDGTPNAYIKIAESVSGAKAELFGYYTNIDGLKRDSNGAPVVGTYNKLSETTPGLKLTALNSKHIASLTVAPHCGINDVGIIAAYTYPGGKTDYRYYVIHIKEASKGLRVLDWINTSYSEDGRPDYSQFSLGENEYGSARYGEVFVCAYGQTRYYLFGVNEGDEMPEDGYTGIVPVTKGLTVKKMSPDGKWSDASKDCVLKLVNDPSLPEELKGLYSLECYSNGLYRVYASDNSYVDFTVEAPSVALYSSKEFSYSTLVKNVVIGDDDNDNQTYYIRLYDEQNCVAGYINEDEIEQVFGPGKPFSFDASNELKPADGVYKITSNGIPGELVIGVTFDISEDRTEETCLNVPCKYTFKGLFFNETVEFDERFEYGKCPLGTLEYPNAWRRMQGWDRDISFDTYFELGINKSEDGFEQINILKSMQGLSVVDEDGNVAANAELSYIGNNTFRLHATRSGNYRVVYSYGGYTSYFPVRLYDPSYSFYELSAYDENTNTFNFGDDNRINGSRALTVSEAKSGIVSFYMLANEYDYSPGFEARLHVGDTIYSESNSRLIVDKMEDATIKLHGKEVTSSIAEVYEITLSSGEAISSYALQIAYNVTGPYYNDFWIGFDPCDMSGAVITVDEDVVFNPAAYNNVPSEEYVTVSLDGVTLSENDYRFDWEYKRNTSVGTGKLRVCSAEGSDFEGSAEGEFNIIEKEFSEYSGNIAEIIARLTTTSPSYSADIRYNDEIHFREGRDYDIEYGYVSPLEDGNYELSTEPFSTGRPYYAKVTYKGQYKGTEYFEYYYRPNSFKKEDNLIGSDTVVYQYDGKIKCPSPVIVVDNYQLVDGTDFIIKDVDTCETITDEYIDEHKEYFTNASESAKQFIVEGIGNYRGSSFEMKMIIAPLDISAAKGKLTLNRSKVSYSDIADDEFDAKSLIKSVVVAGITLNAEDESCPDYEVVFDPAVGTPEVKVVGRGNFCGSLSSKITVPADYNISKAAIDLDPESVVYWGTLPEIESEMISVTLEGFEEPLEPECYYVKAVSVKDGKLTLTVWGNASRGYTGEKTVACPITRGDISDITLEFAGNRTEYSYTGQEIRPEFRVKSDEIILTAGTDYTVVYDKAVDAREEAYKVTVTGKGNYAGTLEAEFKVVPISLEQKLSDNGFRMEDVEELGYDAYTKPFYAKESGETISVDLSLADLAYGVDYKLYRREGESYTELESTLVELEAGTIDTPNRFVGKYVGLGNYSKDSLGNEINIEAYSYEKTDISKYLAEGIVDKTYTGSELTQDDLVVKKDDESEPLIKDTDYKLIYENNVNAGKAKVYITGIGSYTGQIVKDFTVKPYADSFTIDLLQWAYIDDTGKLVPHQFRLSDSHSNYLELNKDYKIVKYTNDDQGKYTAKAVRGYPIYAIVQYKGNYAGLSAIPSFYTEGDKNYLKPILGINLNSDKVTFTGLKDIAYTGKALSVKPTFKYAKLGINLSSDVTVEYFDAETDEQVETLKDVNNGGYYIKITAKDGSKYSGTYSTKDAPGGIFHVTKAPMSKVALALNNVKINYDSYLDEDKNFTFDPSVDPEDRAFLIKSVKFGGIDVDESQYDIVLNNAAKPGTATITLVAKEESNFEGSVSKTFNIEGTIDINSDDISVTCEPVAYYNPSGAVAEITVSLNGENLVLGKDYKVTYTNNKVLSEDGKFAQATITGMGKYKGTYNVKPYFEVVPCDISDEACVKFEASNAKLWTEGGLNNYIYATSYTGKAITYDPKIKINGKAITKGKDYTVTYINCITGEIVDSIVDAGVYTCFVRGIGNYYGECPFSETDIKVYVIPANASKFAVTAFKSVEYSGKKPQDVVTTVKFGNVVLEEGIDYDVIIDAIPQTNVNLDSLESWIKKNYKIDTIQPTEPEAWPDYDCINSGKKNVYILGKGNFEGVKTAAYTVTGYDISKAKFGAIAAEEYNGEAHEPDLEAAYTMKVGKTNQTFELQEHKDYELEFANNIKAGNATVTVKGIGRFSGSKKLTFKILPKDASQFECSIEDAVYLGTAVKQDVLIQDDAYTLVQNIDYTLSYSNNTNVADKNAKKAPTVTVKFKGNYKGTLKQTFTIAQKNIEDADVSIEVKNVKVPANKAVTNKYQTVPVITYNGKKLANNKDFRCEYYYAEDTIVIRNNQPVIVRGYNEGVNEIPVSSSDVNALGTQYRVHITGIGNYEGLSKDNFYYAVQ